MKRLLLILGTVLMWAGVSGCTDEPMERDAQQANTDGEGESEGDDGEESGDEGDDSEDDDEDTGADDTGDDDDSQGDCNTEPLVLDNHPPPAQDYTEEAAGVPVEMVYIPGGTFTLGCDSGSCPADTTPVDGVSVSSYHIMKTEVKSDMWNAVMGEDSGGFGGLSFNWYEAMDFACKLSHMSGKAYRMMTEAEFEYAAKNHGSSLEDIGSDEEWAYNSWSTSHSTELTDPVGPNSGKHTQKTRRDAQGYGDSITARLIRSIDGIGPQLRLVVVALGRLE